jgi:hypothetical protein
LYVNQQMIRNAFVPWDNIESIELKGNKHNPIISLKFKDIDALLKGQFFILKSISKSWLKTGQGINILKDETVGDLTKMYGFIEERMK